MADSTFIGSTLSVFKGAAPTSNTSAESSWGSSGTLTEVVNTQSVGPLGDTTTPIEYNILKEGRVKRLPGAVDGGVVPITVVFDADDMAANKGGGIIKTEADSSAAPAPHQFVVADADTNKYAFEGTIADWQWATRDNSTVKMYNFNIYVTSPIYGPLT